MRDRIIILPNLPPNVLQFQNGLDYKNVEFLKKKCKRCHTKMIRISYIIDEPHHRIIMDESCICDCQIGLNRTRDIEDGEAIDIDGFKREIINNGGELSESDGRPGNVAELKRFIRQARINWLKVPVKDSDVRILNNYFNCDRITDQERIAYNCYT